MGVSYRLRVIGSRRECSLVGLAWVVTWLALSGRGAMARIVDHLSVEQLEARYRAARDVTEARHSGDLAAGAGTDLPRSGRGAGLCAALAGGVGGPLQRAWPCGAGRPAATERPGGEPAAGRRAGRPGRAAADPARRRRAVERPQGGGLERVHPQRGWEALKRIGWSVQAPRPRHPRAATPEQRAAFKGGSMPLSPRPGRRTPSARSRSGRRTVERQRRSTASA